MTVPIWPDDLPQWVLVDGFQSATRGRRLVTAMETGAPKQRRNGPWLRPSQATILVDDNQLARFQRFHEEETGGGVLPFLKSDVLFDGRGILDESGSWLQDESGNGLLIESWVLAQFGQSDPAYTSVDGVTFRIQFELIELP